MKVKTLFYIFLGCGVWNLSFRERLRAFVSVRGVFAACSLGLSHARWLWALSLAIFLGRVMSRHVFAFLWGLATGCCVMAL